MDPGSKDAQRAVTIVSCIMTAFGTLAVVLRIVSRHMVVHGLGADDWWMLVGLFCTGAYLFECLYGIRFGIALYSSALTPHEMVVLLKIIFSIQLTYNTAISAIKISIVCFYLRLGSSRWLRTLSLATIAFIVVLYVATQTTTMVQCIPIKANWEIFDTAIQARKKCIDTLIYFYVIAGINILVDTWILLLPINTLRKIKRPKRDKIMLFVIFGVGGFSCISSMIRLYTIRVFAGSKDPFHDGAPINIWSFVEINIAIICASVPAMKPLFSKVLSDRWDSMRRSRGYQSNSFPMAPLDESDSKLVHNPYRNRINMNKSVYSANATTASRTQVGAGDSEEDIIAKHGIGVIEYAREFTFEEQYIEDPKLPEKAHE